MRKWDEKEGKGGNRVNRSKGKKTLEWETNVVSWLKGEKKRGMLPKEMEMKE